MASPNGIAVPHLWTPFRKAFVTTFITLAMSTMLPCWTSNYVGIEFISSSLWCRILQFSWMNAGLVAVVSLLVGMAYVLRPLHDQNLMSSATKVPYDLFDKTAVEPDANVQTCVVLFGHDAVHGIGEHPTSRVVPDFLKNAIAAHHWVLIFKFSPFKIMIAELDFNEVKLITPVYRNHDSTDSARYARMFLMIGSFKLSPQQVQKACKMHPMNSTLYDLKGNSCQEWVITLATMLGFRTEFDSVLRCEMKDQQFATSVVDTFRMSKSKFEAAERRALVEHLNELRKIETKRLNEAQQDDTQMPREMDAKETRGMDHVAVSTSPVGDFHLNSTVNKMVNQDRLHAERLNSKSEVLDLRGNSGSVVLGATDPNNPNRIGIIGMVRLTPTENLLIQKQN